LFCDSVLLRNRVSDLLRGGLVPNRSNQRKMTWTKARICSIHRLLISCCVARCWVVKVLDIYKIRCYLPRVSSRNPYILGGKRCLNHVVHHFFEVVDALHLISRTILHSDTHQESARPVEIALWPNAIKCFSSALEFAIFEGIHCWYRHITKVDDHIPGPRFSNPSR
jgi:hypothetical protein